MSNKLTWSEIKKLFPNQWVELVECEWDEFEPSPRSGMVRCNAKRRKEIHEQYMSNPVDNSSIVLYGKDEDTRGHGA